MPNQNYIYNERKALSKNTFTKTGYTFIGWSITQGGDIAYLDQTQVLNLSIENNSIVTLYAVWSINKYHIRFNLGDSLESETSFSDTDLLKAGTYKDGDHIYCIISIEGCVYDIYADYGTNLIDLIPGEYPIRTGRTFLGWSKTVDKVEDQDIDIYALWSQIYDSHLLTINIIDENNEIIGNYLTIQVEYNESITQFKPKREGYDAEIYLYDGLEYQLFDINTHPLMPDYDLSIYVRFSIMKYTITYYSNSNSPYHIDIEKEYGTSYEIIGEPNDGLIGFTFSGWYSENDSLIIYYSPGQVININKDLVLYALWNETEYNVTYYNGIGGDKIYETTTTNVGVSSFIDYIYLMDEEIAGYSAIEDAISSAISGNVDPITRLIILVNLAKNLGFDKPLFDLLYDSITEEFDTLLINIATSSGASQEEAVNELLGAIITNDQIYGRVTSAIISASQSDLEDLIRIVTYFTTYNAVLNAEELGLSTLFDLIEDNTITQLLISLAQASTDTEKAEIIATLYNNPLVYNESYSYPNFSSGYDYIKYAIDVSNTNTDPLNLVVGYVMFKYLDNIYEYSHDLSDIKNLIDNGDTEYLNAILLVGSTTGSEQAQNVASLISLTLLRSEYGSIISAIMDSSTGNLIPLLRFIYYDVYKDYPTLYFLSSKLDYVELIINFPNVQEPLLNATNDALLSLNAIFNAYRDNAYYPYKEGYIFEKWSLQIEDNNYRYYANWIKPLDAPLDLRLDTFKNKYVIFTWNIVDDAYLYEVMYKINDDVYITRRVDINSITIPVNEDGTTISIKVRAIYNPETLTLQNTYKGEIVTAINSVDMNSPFSLEIHYTHSVSIGATQTVESQGNYYYRVEGESESDPEIYYLFTGQSYSFSNATNVSINGTTSSARIQIIHNKYYLITTSKAGEFTFTVTKDEIDTTYRAIVQLTPQAIIASGPLKSYETNHRNALDGIINPTFIHQSDSFYCVGVSSLDAYDNGLSYVYNNKTYYNGFILDFVASTTSGINTNIEFSIEVEKDSMMQEEGKDYILEYDIDNQRHIIYFLKIGTYNITLKEKEDVSDTELNTQIPKIMKENETLRKTFNVCVNEGVNVYTDFGLKETYGDLDVSIINLHSNIEAILSPNMVAYYEYLIDSGLTHDQTNDYDTKYLGESSNIRDLAELNVKSGTAVMTDDIAYGPMIWIVNATNPLFRDVDGVGYSYSKTQGTHVIKSCEWIKAERTEEDKGTFKIINSHIRYYDRFSPYDLKIAYLYQRIVTDEGKGDNVILNGNYFTVDGKDLPYIASGAYVQSIGTFQAAYQIQNVQVAMFVYASKPYKVSNTQVSELSEMTINDLGIIGNSMDVSAWLQTNSGSISSVSEYMARTSGTYCGIQVTQLEWGPLQEMTELSINNVSIENTLIGLYVQSNPYTISNYLHIKQTWANSIYSNGGHNYLYNSYIETSGGGATQADDIYYMGNLNGNTFHAKEYTFIVDGSTREFIVPISCDSITNITIGDEEIDSSLYSYNPISRVVTLDDRITTPQENTEVKITIRYKGINASMIIDDATIINNLVSGDEQWFKAYGMEVMGLGLKAQVEAGIQDYNNYIYSLSGSNPNYTIIQPYYDTLLGQQIDKINLVFVAKNNDVSSYITGSYNVSDVFSEYSIGDVANTIILAESENQTVKLITTINDEVYVSVTQKLGQDSLIVVLKVYTKNQS